MKSVSFIMRQISSDKTDIPIKYKVFGYTKTKLLHLTLQGAPDFSNEF